MEFQESDWAWVPEIVLEGILDCIVSFYDYARFGAVCKHWYCVAKYRRRQFMELWSRQLPLLMIPAADGRRDQRRLHNVVTGKTYDFLLSLRYDRRCVGYSHGWLATNCKNTIITLRNPFLNQAILLPSLKSPFQMSTCPTNWYDYDVNKVVLSHNPYLYPDRYAVMSMSYVNISLAVLKPGSDSWTHFDKSQNDTDDIIYHKGVFLAVDRKGELVEIKCLNSSSPKMETIVSRENCEKIIHTIVYLVESSDGSLLLIRKYMDFYDDVTPHFKVSRLVRSENKVKKPYWDEIKSLGDEAVFVGDSDTLCIRASNFPGCRPNCIYFDYHSGHYLKPRKLCDMGIFNLEDGSITGHYTSDDESLNNWPHAAWIVPTLGDEATVNPKSRCAPHLQF
ncbi:F-box protein At2g17036-like [Tripterygium wilfordii]|uniref:F-box protein At2g17036-like n=1 Tax=Tripterygium wilfordii TaxID=458696 RepID=UPI0018F826A2|nr:F-box protein At2g17036-like [Tripterygium wilfordii]XP_038683803.1 F-box protein At2g17036-like [Tripterygium wilfordii]XP_038683804.1 F-box protein At2g17036-like [Tripterygium wilfordii]XP_038683805.1 F-box protein At2g17036-like [Tripterygium wilfordii]